MKKIVFICAAMMAFAATAFAQECEYDQQTGVIKIWKHTGMLKGYFTVNAEGKQVRFSQGNLQYNSDTQKWQFAEHQYDSTGDAAGNKSLTADGKTDNTGIADLFGWVGASSSWTGLKQYGLTSATTVNAVDGYGNVTDEGLKSDWGTLMGSTWRTLTNDEWGYVFRSRSGDKAPKVTISGTPYTQLYAVCQSGSFKRGVILFPDGGTFDESEFTSCARVYRSYSYQIYVNVTLTLEQWEALEEKGCVFFPVGGHRYPGGTIYMADGGAFYWSSTPAYNSSVAYYEQLYSSTFSETGYYRNDGMCVRLVKDVVVTP